MKDGLRKIRIHFEFVMESLVRKLLSGLVHKSCKCFHGATSETHWKTSVA